MHNSIYLLQEREFINSNENIYKIGRTKQANIQRFNQYPKGSKLLLHIVCDDCDILETELIRDFKNKYIHRKDIGNEYFEGDYKEMIKDIYNKITNCENIEDLNIKNNDYSKLCYKDIADFISDFEEKTKEYSKKINIKDIDDSDDSDTSKPNIIVNIQINIIKDIDIDDNKKKTKKTQKDLNIEKMLLRQSQKDAENKEMLLRQSQKDADYEEIMQRIKLEYPDGIKEPRLKKHFSIIVPKECKTCHLYKILPYDYISDTCNKTDIDNCKLCVSIIYKSAKKCREEKTTKCECGINYYASEDNTARHLASDSHIKRMALVINGQYYKRTELFVLAKQYKIPYYKIKNNDELVAILKNIIID